MGIHSSFRSSGGATKHRNVLTRLERLEKLEGAGRWDAKGNDLFGLPKVRSIKVAMKKKKKKEAEEEDAKK
ncbi:MAG: small basic protein [Planctomycetota bacterium]|nr:small basic protein [Planctomycetota bacterium]